MIHIRAKRENGIFNKSRGLIGKKTPGAIFLTTRFGIHTFFLSFPIDVIVLNDQHIVVALKESLLPNRIFIWNPKYSHVLELPNGEIKRNKLKIGQKIQISDYSEGVSP